MQAEQIGVDGPHRIDPESHRVIFRAHPLPCGEVIERREFSFIEPAHASIMAHASRRDLHARGVSMAIWFLWYFFAGSIASLYMLLRSGFPCPASRRHEALFIIALLLIGWP